MDFTTTDEQDALRDAVRGLLGRHYPSTEARRAILAKDGGFDAQLWSRLADLGVLGLPFSEAVGGAGGGAVEVAVVAEEMGRALAPEPFVDAVVLAGGLVADVGTPEQQCEIIGRLASGHLLPAYAALEPGRRWDAQAIFVQATRDGDGWRVSGTKEPVRNGGSADLLIVSAATVSGTALFLVLPDQPGVARRSYPTPDGGWAASITFDAAVATPLGAPEVDATTAIEAVLDRARLASAHEALGAMDFAVTTTTGYLRSRRQFGATLNVNQALTHRAAEMYVALELARSTVLWATAVQDAFDSGDTALDVTAAVSHAWWHVARAARSVGQEAIQLHGGIGLTAEYSVGHYVSRMVSLEKMSGDQTFHRNRLLVELGDHDSLDPVV